MGFFDRLANFFKGLFSTSMRDLEASNPDAVYQAAIDERVKRAAEMRKAVANLIYLRNTLQERQEEQSKALAKLNAQLPLLVEEGDDEGALLLIEQRTALGTQLQTTQDELAAVQAQVDEAQSGIVRYEQEIGKLKEERERVIASKKTAEARIQVQETLSGLSTSADVQALENVRENVKKLQAEAQLNAELASQSTQSKLDTIEARTAQATAKAELAELKKQMEAKKAQSEQGNIKKNI